MSINFHANQYEQAFAPHRLQNWESPKSAEGKVLCCCGDRFGFRIIAGAVFFCWDVVCEFGVIKVFNEYPRAHTGFTRISANDRGHLLPNIPKNRSSPWGTFVGTWDMPNQIPGNRALNPTARSEEAWLKNKKAKEDSDVILSGALKKCHTVDPLPVKMDTPEDEQSPRPDNGLGGLPVCGTRCPPEETTDCKVNINSAENHDCLKWPKAKSPACRSPVGYALTPKPMKTMNAANLATERDESQQCPALASEN